jgi:hypothetical protein
VDPALPCYPRARLNLTATCSGNLEVDVIICEAVRAMGEPDAEAAVPDALDFVSRCLIRGSLILEVVETLFGAFADLNFVLLGAPDFRFGTRGFCTSSIGDEHQSDENGRDGDPKLRKEKEQEEIVSRFESLLPKWSSNTPLLLNDLQVNFSSVMHVSCTPCIRGPSLTC